MTYELSESSMRPAVRILTPTLVLLMLVGPVACGTTDTTDTTDSSDAVENTDIAVAGALDPASFVTGALLEDVTTVD